MSQQSRGIEVQFILKSKILSEWFGDEDPFQKVAAIKGRVVRSKEGRTTQRFEIQGQGFYAKHHLGIGWGEIFKNLLQFRLPITGATNEWRAIQLLDEHKVDTLNAVAFGKKGINPAAQESFIITEELVDTTCLDVFSKSWSEHAPDLKLKRALIDKVAIITRTIHQAGMNHRDLYICHFLLSNQIPESVENHKDIRLHLIDLHRAQCRARVPYRWQVKDVGSLLFSAMDVGLTSRDIWRFLKVYFDKPLRNVFEQEQRLLRSIEGRAIRLYRRDFKRSPSLPYLS